MPVLLLAYNRPEQTERVLKRLKECGSTNLFVSQDGPKNQKDEERTKAVTLVISKYKTIISETNISPVNLGCKTGVISGINWFFSQVPEGIILEDDCLPNATFFEFTNELLKQYREEPCVFMISGNNPLGNWESEAGYHFSRIGHVWGWATWKDRWEKFDPMLPEFGSFENKNGLERKFGPTALAKARKELAQSSLKGEINTWDYQWNTHFLMNGGLAIISENNLIENIGFDSQGTHINQKPDWISVKAKEANPIRSHPQKTPDREYEMELFLAQTANSPAIRSSFSFQNRTKNETRKLRVVSINSTDYGGGAEKIAYQNHQRLIELGHDSTLLVSIKKSDDISVQEINQDWQKQITELEPDVIHVHNLHGTSISLNEVVSVSKTVPTLFTLHDSWLTTGSKDHPFQQNGEELSLLELNSWRKELDSRKQTISRLNIRWTAPSQWMRERFFRLHGIRPFFVPNGVDIEEPLNIEMPSNRFILFVANRPETNPYKDFASLEKAWIKANRSLGKNGCDLICIGGKNQSISKHDNYQLQVLDKSDKAVVNAYMQKAILVVQPSLQDNAPLTIIEAHLCGNRVVSSLVGGIPELVDELEESWLYEAGNMHDLSESLIAAISYVDANPNSQFNGHLKSMELMVDTYLGHYHDLVNG